MFKIFVFLVSLVFTLPLCYAGGLGNVNIDTKTTAAMTAAYAEETATEILSNEHVQKILDHYTSAEVASAGIFASKWLDRKAMANAGLFSDQENWYYKRIYHMVSVQIMPKILTVASLMIKHPEKALYWGPYLYRTCEQVKQLCMTFEVVVANGKNCTFSDVAFLAIDEQFRDLFDLARFGEVDWKTLWEDLTEFGSGITKEDLEQDLKNLVSAGGALASAGGAVITDAAHNGSQVFNVFSMKLEDVLGLYDKFEQLYDVASHPAEIKNLVMQKLVSTDSTGVARLFTAGGYNITSYISDYLNQMQGRYYTQRWYIYWTKVSTSVVCDYHPPMDEVSISRGDEWYRESSTDEYYSPSDGVIEMSLRNSESYAEWSRMMCNLLNKQSRLTGSTYTFESCMHGVRLYGKGGSGNGKLQAWSFAHDIKVTRSTNFTGVVYDEVFDSQYSDESVMMARFSARLQELNDNEEGIVYMIGKDKKVYYDSANTARMKGCSAVSYTMSCEESTGLGEGSFSWKENGDQRHALDEKSKKFAMESSLPEAPNTYEVDESIAMFENLVEETQNRIDDLNFRKNQLLNQISHSSVDQAEALRMQYDNILKEIKYYQGQLSSASNNLKQAKELRQQLLDDYADEEDDAYRIPHVMHEIQSAYGIEWQDEGQWEGWNFIRHGNLPNMNAVITFTAELSKERGESHNWLIGRYHRAILAVHWTLGADYSSSEVVDFMEINPDLDDGEKANIVNQRLRELRNEHPGCSIDANYSYSNPPDVSEDEDALHLLWVCDRLAIARDIDHRLSKIYAQLVLIEKFMRSRESILNYFKRTVGLTGVTHTGRSRIGGKSYDRWRHSASKTMPGTDLAEAINEALSDDDLQARY